MTLSCKRRRDQARARRAKVWLNGRDVTRDCFYVDVRRGVVRMYARRNGKLFTNIAGDGVATEERRGRVRLKIRPMYPALGDYKGGTRVFDPAARAA